MIEPPVPPRPEPQRRMLPPASALERVREHWEDPRGPRRRAHPRRGACRADLVPARVSGQLGHGIHPGHDDHVVRGSGHDDGNDRAVQHAGRLRARPRRGRRRSSRCRPHPRRRARVNDAVEAAGGGLPGADLDRLNLAAKVADGQRIAVALVGAPAPVEAGTGGVTGTGTGGEATTGPININTASSAQLEELPGIGPSLAGAIIAEREKRGGFKEIGELQDVRGIGEVRYADIKDLVTV